jgi:glycosyltransferase involved in cell wall biosynthesis
VSARPTDEPAALSDAGLELDLETPLPPRIAAGRGTAVFLAGSCFHRRAEIRELVILAGARRHRVAAARMPRIDVFRAMHPRLADREADTAPADPTSPDDPELRSYRSGFWTTLPIEPLEAGGRVELGVEARLADGSRARAALGTIEVASDVPPAPPGAVPRAGPETIAICMATFDPDPGLLRAQVDSIRGQTDRDWICVISDDHSSPEAFAALEEVVGEDPRFALSRSPRRLGFYRNFERALAMAPREAGLVAFSDQDDVWAPEKLSSLRAAIGSAQLVFSDQRLVASDGRVLAPTYWTERRNNHTNLISLLIANTVTGAASLFRREVADLALPFPEVPGEQYHDHWVALVAMGLGRIAYVDRPLYDYVQHGASVLGHEEANAPVARGEDLGPVARIGLWRRSMGDWRWSYFHGYVRLQVLAQALICRCGPRLGRRKRRALRRFVRAERSLAGSGWLLARLARGRAGLTETLGMERLLLRGIAWRRLVPLRTWRAERPRSFFHEAGPPLHERRRPLHGHEGTAHLQEKIEPLPVVLDPDAPERVNLLLPAIDLKHLFGGYIAKFNLARRLAAAGLRVRLVTVDESLPLPRSWRRQVERYGGLEGLFDQVEVAFGREHGPLPVGPRDAFVATTFWTAHAAAAAVAATERQRFLYLIQEYEPYTFAMGSWAAAARRSYELPHVALFSTELLRDFFAARGYGVFAAGAAEGERDSASFQNAITRVPPPRAQDLAARQTRRLLFYARPEPHAARNMFELGLMSLVRAAEEGVFGPEWELSGIGTVRGRDSIPLTPDASLRILPRTDQHGYADLLAAHDVGLALMLTPHPSLVPIEMASAGMLTVTSAFETKTPAAMSAISPNLLTVGASPEEVAAGLAEAVSRVADHSGRAAGAEVAWSRDWEESLGPEVMDRVLSLLERC